jgi:hypothetical protein
VVLWWHDGVGGGAPVLVELIAERLDWTRDARDVAR